MIATTCPNCGAYRSCDCTWAEKQKAVEIRRRKAAEFRRKIGKPTVVEQYEIDQRKGTDDANA